MHLGRSAALHGVERAGAYEREARRALPAHVDEHGVAERRAPADELAVLERKVGQVPVEPGVEPRGQRTGDVTREHGCAEENCLGSGLLHGCGHGVHARLRQRRGERVVFADVHGRSAERARLRRRVARAGSEHDADCLAERGGLRQDSETALLELAVVVLEKDETLHSNLFSSR